MIVFLCTLAMKKKMISYGITRIFFNLFRNILLIWHNKDMKILLFIIIGFTFVIILNFYRFKSLILPLYIWSYFPKNWLHLFFSFFESSSSVGHSFFVIFVCWGFMWVMFVVTSTARATIIVFIVSPLILFILLVSQILLS